MSKLTITAMLAAMIAMTPIGAHAADAPAPVRERET